jgi:hypothetical protein
MPEDAVGDVQVLNEIALTIMDDEGQVAVADMVARGDAFQAQVMLVRVAYQQYQAGDLTEVDYSDIITRTGLSERRVENIIADLRRGDELRIWDNS